MVWTGTSVAGSLCCGHPAAFGNCWGDEAGNPIECLTSEGGKAHAGPNFWGLKMAAVLGLTHASSIYLSIYIYIHMYIHI